MKNNRSSRRFLLLLAVILSVAAMLFLVACGPTGTGTMASSGFGPTGPTSFSTASGTTATASGPVITPSST